MQPTPNPYRGQCETIFRKGAFEIHRRGTPTGFPSDVREEASSGVMMIPIPREGIYKGVEQLEQAAQVLGIEAIEITAKLRQKLVPLPEGSSYLGFIFARGDSPQYVESALREAHRKLRFVISSSLPVV